MIKRIIWILFAAGAATGLFFQFSYHKFLNNDTLAYINIAQLYAQGQWQQAINGCWSPLYSWILALCDLLHIPLLGACYVLNFVAAGFTLHLAMRIGERFIKQPLFYYLFCFYSLVVLLYYSMSTLTPDLLSLACSFLFLQLLLDERFALAGLAAALMYFAKLYNFVMLHLFFVVLIFFNRRILKTYGVFIGIALVWITILSIHEHKLTFSTTGRLTHNLVGPDYTWTYPLFNGLYPPPSPGAYSVLIDPAHLLDDHDWSPFESKRNFLHQLWLVWDAFRFYYNILDNHRIKTILFIAAFVLIWKKRKRFDGKLNVLLIFFLVYPLFYFPIFIIDRYVLVCLLLFNFFFFYTVNLATDHFDRRRVTTIALAVVAIALVPLIISAKNKATITAKEYPYYRAFYQRLPDMEMLRDQRVAADMLSSLQVIQLCYHLHCRYYATWTDKKIESLKRYGIRYYITQKEESSLPLAKRIQIGQDILYIYDVQLLR